jgi:hypothetical protein
MRALISSVLIAIMPGAVFAADPPAARPAAAVVYGTGSVYLDGAQLANSMPVMTGDIVETKDISSAHIDMSGSTAIVQANAIVRFRDGGVALDRGHISMATGKSAKVFARDFEITPTSTDWTQYEVVRSAGLIHISALKRDVEIKCGAEKPTIIREGHEITRADAQNCGLIDKAHAGAPTAATGPLLASPWAEGAGLATGSGLIVWTLAHGDEPLSPDGP